MPRSICLAAAVILLTLALAGRPQPVGARGSFVANPSDLCLIAAREASRRTGVPLQILLALTLTETGRADGEDFQPWPWALNAGGQGYWFETREDALNWLTAAAAQGPDKIDIGCFQLSSHWHGRAFQSAEEMIDPLTNALYAARLIARHASEQGDWVAAAGAYHSATPEKAESYLARFRPIYAALGDDTSSPDGVPSLKVAEKPRGNRFPLLVAGKAGAAGSLVPLRNASRALIGRP